MRSTVLVAVSLIAAPLSAQTIVETGGGVARLDHFSGGAFSSFRAVVHQNYGGLLLAFMNNTTDHHGLGTAYQTDLSLHAPFFLGSWQLTFGPQLHLARGIENPSTRTIGADVNAARDLGRLHLTGGVQRGSAWYGSQHNDWTVAEIKLNTEVGAFQFGTSLTSLSMSDSVPRTDVFFDLRDPRRDTLYRERIQYTHDVGVNVGWGAGRVSLDGRVGERFRSGASSTGWWEGNLAVRVASSLAITIGSSLLPEDPLLRLHGGHFTSLGVRIGTGPGGHAPRLAASPDPMAVEITRAEANIVSLKFAIPGARNSATIMGEFSGWKPIALTRLDDGRWEARIEALPGLYRMNIRADGGAWSVPPGMHSVADDFGGVVGLLVVQ